MSNTNSEQMVDIFNFAENYLTTICPSNINLNKYLNNEKSFQSINEIAEGLIHSLQNRNQMPNIIKYDKNRNMLRDILFDFDPNSILSQYNEQSLFSKFKGYFTIKNTESPRNLWLQYAKYILSACRFMSSFESAKSFDEFIMSFSKNELSRAALPMLLSKEVSGLGFTLACDFLKELGYNEYPKPDIHLRDVFSTLNICDNEEYEVYKAIIKMAVICGKSTYHVDKTFWLICSGNYYLDNLQVTGKKKEFISAYNKYKNILA